MVAQVVNPFIESAQTVIAQVANVTAKPGDILEGEMPSLQDYVWIKISITGNLSGDIAFGIENNAALIIISRMMGGFEVKEIDSIGLSAISELGNMISGNASTLCYNNGLKIDITPPEIINKDQKEFESRLGYTVPIEIENVGKIRMHMILAS